MYAYDDPPDHTLAEGDCMRCECPATLHDASGECSACDCPGYQGSADLGERDEPEEDDDDVVDGPCEYERIGRGQ